MYLFYQPRFHRNSKRGFPKETTILVGGQWCFPSRVLCSQCESSVGFQIRVDQDAEGIIPSRLFQDVLLEVGM